ncbi:hypothetical protein NEOLEDRAFT_1216217 [Neolentinus lepideus HHB14362 ss-1]|uniref:Uncharacterized protein n=1 Tax=Neolentinus lepideus HHB14362 ss-1 TaxID=1314782 RepID=A0A165QSH4_9AGAM|nr:hypothetical protein NEOLEDRAFT_1216217 [Neolentinus lepideus HHB14362 ss-1]
MATTHNFVGDKLVDELPAQATQKINDDELTKREAQRLQNGAREAGVNKRAGAAALDPSEHDSRSQNTSTHSDPKPVQDPVL